MNTLVVRSLALALWLASTAGIAAASSGIDDDAEQLVTRSTSGYASERDTDQRRDPGTLKELSLAPNQVVTQAKSSSSVKAVFWGDAWIYDVHVDLLEDFDRDGYHSYFRVVLDADSLFDRHWVYAVLLLSGDGVRWEEIHVTDDFLIRGQTSNDAYEIEVELVSGYPAGLYDLLIELYDADYSLLIDELGPAHASALSLLPLEDTHRDGLYTTIVVTETRGGGGSVSWLMLLLLGGAALVQRPRGHSPAATDAAAAGLPMRTSRAPNPL
jgi:hypothetical protein